MYKRFYCGASLVIFFKGYLDQKKDLALREERVRSETVFVQKEKSTLCSRSESLADSIRKLQEEKDVFIEELNQVVEQEENIKEKMEHSEGNRISLSESRQKLNYEIEEKDRLEQELSSKIAEKKELKKKLCNEVEDLKK